MSASIILLDRNFSANDADIMVFEPCVLFSPCGRFWGKLNTWSTVPLTDVPPKNYRSFVKIEDLEQFRKAGRQLVIEVEYFYRSVEITLMTETVFIISCKY